MIAEIAAFAAVAMQAPDVVEWLEPSWNVASIQAVVKLPPLSQRERALLTQIVGTLGSETKTYGGSQIADLAARAGSRLRATLMEDHVRVGMEVVSADVTTGIGMVGAVLREPVVSTTKLETIAQDLQFRRTGYWRQALEQYRFQPEKYSAREVPELMEKVFRPENITLGVGGRISPGAATQRWDDIRSAWTVRKLPRSRPPNDVERPLARLDAKVSVLDFQAEPFSASDAAFTTRLLALTALGTGKGASLWKVSREALGASYRQEAVLYPTHAGFQPRLLIAHSRSEGLEELGAKIREGLLADIAGWTEEDRKRAIGMAESYLVRGGEFSPLYFAPGRPMDRELGDQTFLQAYWPMKTGARWNPHQIVGRMGFVELADLKSTAQKMVSGARLLIHKGRN